MELLYLKNTVDEKKKINWIGLDTAEEKISELEDIVVEIIPNETHWEKNVKNKQIRELWENLKGCNVYVTGVTQCGGDIKIFEKSDYDFSKFGENDKPTDPKIPTKPKQNKITENHCNHWKPGMKRESWKSPKK